MANVTAPSLSIDDGTITWEDMTIDGNLTLNGNITLGSGGSYAAGSLYADSNWGMIFRAKTSNPAASDFLWTDGASDDHLMKLDNATGLSVHNGSYRFQAAEVTGSTDVFLVRSGATTNAGGNDRAAWIQHVRSSADANKWRFWFAQDNNSGASNVMTMAFNNASIPKGTVGIGTDAPTRSLDIRHNNHRGTTSTDDVDYEAVNILADNYGDTITNTSAFGLFIKNDWRGYDTGGTFTNSEAIGAKIVVDSSWGVLPNAYGLIIAPEVYNYQTMTNWYGLRLNSPTLGTGAVLTNRWGVYQTDAATKNYFEGKVGIGTINNPTTHNLQIEGSTNGEHALLKLANTNTGSSAYAEMDIFSSTANLRIGITDPSYSGWSGGAFIRNQTNGQIRIGTATNIDALTVDSYGAYIYGDMDDKSIVTNTGTGNAILATHTGSNTPVPWDIREQSSTDNNQKNYAPLWITRMNATADGAGSNLHFRMKKNNGDPFEVGGIGASIEAGLTSSANVNGQLNFYTTSNNSTRIQRMTISHDGNVGIGQTAPATKLHLMGNMTLDTSNGAGWIYLKGQSANDIGVAWTFSTAADKYASIRMDHTSRATTGLQYHTTYYPMTFDVGASETSTDYVVFNVNQSEILRLAKTTVTSSGSLHFNDTTRSYVRFDGNPATDHTFNGISAVMQAGEAIEQYDLVYVHSDGKVKEADADAAGTMPVIGIAVNDIANDAEGDILLHGYVRVNSWNWTPGQLLYASTTTGGITATAPSGSGDQVQVVAVAVNADTIYFNPSLTIVQVA